MEDLQQTLQRHGDNNGNLCENFNVDTGPAGLFSLHTCHFLLFLRSLIASCPGGGGHLTPGIFWRTVGIVCPLLFVNGDRAYFK